MICSHTSRDPGPAMVLDAATVGSPPYRCTRPGVRVSLQCPAGRPDAEGGPYCSEHGGEERARSEAESEWHYRAPASVGGMAEVLAAGARGLTSRDAYVVVRQDPNGPWLAYLGIGSHLEQIPRVDYAGCGRARCRSCAEGRYCGRGRQSHPDREAAVAAGSAAWSLRVATDVEAIRTARGGSLAWGAPVVPLDSPAVLDVPAGASAWDVAEATSRVGPRGLAAVSGVRPTGEAY